MRRFKSYEEWEANVPACIRDDVLWTQRAYRIALFLTSLVRSDYATLHAVHHPLADQLYRAVGSIGANIAEGYSRSGARERAHFFEYALGSTRESRHWYFAVSEELGDGAGLHRLAQLTEVARLLVVMIRASRSESIRSDR